MTTTDDVKDLAAPGAERHRRDRRRQRLELQALVQEQLMHRWRAGGGWLLIAAGALAVFLAWFQVRDLPDVALQIPYLVSGGIGGALFMGLGGALLLSQDFSDDKEAMEELRERIDDLEDVIVTQAEIVGQAVAILDASKGSNGTAEKKRPTKRSGKA